MNIAFVANGFKTEFFHLIGMELKSIIPDIGLFFICFGREQYGYYKSSGVSDNNILFLPYSGYSSNNDNPIGEYKLNELIAYDRAMKYSYHKWLKYMVNIQSDYYAFLVRNDIQYVFGEMTWAPEILFARICRDKLNGKCTYLHPQSIRIPNGRFTFMDSEFQDGIYEKAEYWQDKQILKNYNIPLQPIVPQRVADVAKDVRSKMSWSEAILRFMRFLTINQIRDFTRRDKDLYCQVPIKKKRYLAYRFERNKFYYLHCLKTSAWEEIKGKKYVFVTLHMQPEASIDVVGRYYEDQLQNIKNIWRILPFDYYLVVKEHTNAIANRGKDFFEPLKKMRNLIIANENIDSHQIIKFSQGVFTNSGTVALEAALFKKHSFLFSSIFFDKIKYCHRVTWDDFKTCSSYLDLYEKCINRDSNKMDVDSYSEYILRSSFAGVVDPHTGSPLFKDPDNIKTIAKSFATFLNL